jgi:predicted O-methyltransferase YrrM
MARSSRTQSVRDEREWNCRCFAAYVRPRRQPSKPHGRAPRLVSAAMQSTSLDPTNPKGAPKEGLRQLFTRAALVSLLRQPRWFLANMRQGPRWLLDRRKAVPPDRFREHFVTEAVAVEKVIGARQAEFEASLAALWKPKRDPSEPLAVWTAREELLNLVGVLVSLMRPAVVVETGVALGFTTATILAAMEKNEAGHLYSVDLPSLQFDPSREIGSAVPTEIRNRWTLVVGPTQKVLAPLLSDVAPIDLYVHDANHAYSEQLREYRAAWPHLRSGGVLVSDDVGNPAFVEFAQEAGARPYLVPGSRTDSVVGLMRKA